MSCFELNSKNTYCLFTLILFLIAGASLFAQNTGALNGTITSSAGAPVPNATVSVTNSDTGQSRNTITRNDGTFVIVDLTPGTYSVVIEAGGYKRTSQQNVQVGPGSPVKVSATMEAGSSSETVEVKGHAPLIQDDSAEVSHAFTSRTLTDVPFQDRNHQQVVEFMPGITQPTPSIQQSNSAISPQQFQDAVARSLLTDPQRNLYWNTNGQQYQANRQNLDGTDNTEAYRGTAMNLPPLDAVEQVNLITSTYDASQGRAGGSIINLISRAGTNAFHGSAFAFNTNSFSGARDYFNPVGFPQGHNNFNQFGITAGGPIIRDHTFFFVAYEGDYLRQQSSMVTTVPTAPMLNGDFSAVPNLSLYNPLTGGTNYSARTPFSNNVIPASLLNPAARALGAYFPSPNLPGFENNYLVSTPYRDDGNRLDARLDHRFNDRSALFLRYDYSNYRTVTTSPLGPVLGTDSLSLLRSHNAEVGWTGGYRSFIGEFRLGYTRYDDPIRANSAATPASLFGITNPNVSSASLPAIQIAGMSSFGTPANYPQQNVESTWNVATNWSTRWRNNNIRFGADERQIRLDGFQNYLYGPQGGYLFTTGPTSLQGGPGLGPYGDFANSFASFLLGAPTQSGLTQPNYVPSNYTYQVSGYVSDTIQPFSRLTLDIGVRYDFFTPLQPRVAAANSVYNPYTNNLTQLGTNGVDVRGNLHYNTANLAPRFGFGYRLGDHTVVRGGYAISYFPGLLQYQSDSFIPAQAGYEQGVNGTYAVAGRFGVLGAIPTTGTALTNRTFAYTQGTTGTPYVQNFSFQVQHDLPFGIVGDVGYVGSLGRNLPYTQELNAALPGAGVTGLPFYPHTASILDRTTGLTSNYNSLQVLASKRFSKGLSFTAAYTYSKALDYGGGLTPLLDSLNVRANYGPASFDQTHVFTLTHVWQIPIGTGTSHLGSGMLGHVLGPWQLDGVLRYATGTPFTPLADPTACNCPGNINPAYANFLGVGTLTQPLAGQLGNAGRDILRNENIINYDLALFRSFIFLENTKLDFRAEAYNIANSAHLANPITNVNSAYFGQYLNTVPGLGPRSLRLGLRLTF